MPGHTPWEDSGPCPRTHGRVLEERHLQQQLLQALLCWPSWASHPSRETQPQIFLGPSSIGALRHVAAGHRFPHLLYWGEPSLGGRCLREAQTFFLIFAGSYRER